MLLIDFIALGRRDPGEGQFDNIGAFKCHIAQASQLYRVQAGAMQGATLSSIKAGLRLSLGAIKALLRPY